MCLLSCFFGRTKTHETKTHEILVPTNENILVPTNENIGLTRKSIEGLDKN